MNFEPAAHDMGRLMAELLKLIAGMNISPEAKKELLAKSFGSVGAEFCDKMFNDCSELFDSSAIGTLGKADLNNRAGRLAQKLIRNDALSRPTGQILDGYFNSLLASAQEEAFKNAVSLGKVPTLTRSLRGETCGWCQARVGTWTNPSGELFARHDNCDCKIVVSGYNSRNGELKNYTKNSKKKGPNSSRQNKVLSDEEAMEKIGVDRHYWSHVMKPGERNFAKTYPEDIKWITKKEYDSNGNELPNNDFILISNKEEYELKSVHGDDEEQPGELNPKSIRRNIRDALRNPLARQIKTRFMINTRGLVADDKLKKWLENYARSVGLEELRIFDGVMEEIIYQKK